MTRQTFKLLWISCIALSLAASSHAQVGKETDLWDWTPKDSIHHDAIVQVDAGDGTGTGVIIHVNRDKRVKDGYEGYCLTAWHVVQNIQDNSIRLNFRNGRRAKGCQVVDKDVERDIAVLWAWIPEQIVPAKLATQPIQAGDKLEFAGLGGGSDIQSSLRHFSGVASSPSSMEKIFADVPLLPGDSGGPVFNANREVVGIISGGWFWYDGGVKLPNGNEIKATWPARASNVDPIKVLIADLDANPSNYK